MGGTSDSDPSVGKEKARQLLPACQGNMRHAEVLRSMEASEQEEQVLAADF